MEGFVQQLALSYVGHGYWFYVTGVIPERKDPRRVDEKLLEQYDAGLSKWARARRKRAGLSNVHYIRHGRFFVLIASRGEQRFFQDEPNHKDVRRDSIRFNGYSIGYHRGVDRRWHPSVRIHPDEYRKLKAYMLNIAPHRSVEKLIGEFRRIRFEPYAPVRRQLLNLLRAVNRLRDSAGFEPVPVSALRLRRRVVRPFEESNSGSRFGTEVGYGHPKVPLGAISRTAETAGAQ
ncbi:hypothetical protein RAS2_18670 [Phycisphaerae bacterium RAS2]|nr:hypothetical protein RAS2_18670 [Phycisphaerae bacterium RAS2]